MGRPVLRSERIDLLPMTIDHLPFLVELDSDAEVLRYILGRARTTAEVHDFWTPICTDPADLGWWVGRSRDDGELLGWWFLSPEHPPSRPSVRAEAGWRLARRHWGRGLATEGATTVLDHGFLGAGLSTVFAETMAVNLASRAVMAKLGMRHVRTEHRDAIASLPGAERGEVVYEVSREAWIRSRTAPDL
ncbi:MAG: GNAT family N-acetyltransferase [Actinobacteria bacterium]|nr:GNAT family N-acetyltransferase [Actinomycetota bacterium]